MSAPRRLQIEQSHERAWSMSASIENRTKPQWQVPDQTDIC
jgi:hypothetical protein